MFQFIYIFNIFKSDYKQVKVKNVIKTKEDNILFVNVCPTVIV